MAKHDDLPNPAGKSGPGATPGKPEKDPKDKPELGGVGEDPADKKNSPPPHKQPDTPNTIHNRDQDPNHPANTTLSPKADPMPRPVAEGITVPPDEMRTEQEKLAADALGDPNAGVGPVTPAAYTSGPVETIDDLGIGPRTPYPTGNPPPSREEVTFSQGIWHGDEADAPVSANRRTKDDYHSGDTVADGPDREKNMRQREQDEADKARDRRPQERVGGPQEKTTPPKGSGR